MATEVAQEIVLLPFLLTHDSPEVASLHEVIVRDFRTIGGDSADPFIVSDILRSVTDRPKARADVIRVRAVVAVDSTWAVTLIGRVYSIDRGIAGQLLIVWAQTVAGRVRVAEHAGLQHYKRQEQQLQLIHHPFNALLRSFTLITY